MKRISFAVLILLTTYVSGADKFTGSIKLFIDNKPVDSYYKVDNEYLTSGKCLSLFYINRFYTPAWFIQNTLGNNGYVLLEYIRRIELH